MAESSPHGRGKKNPPKVPDKASHSTTPYQAKDPKPTAQDNGVSTATVDSNARPIAKPRNVNIPPTFQTPKLKSSTERKIGVLLPCFTEYEAQNASNRKPLSSSGEHPTATTNAASPEPKSSTLPTTPSIEYENTRSATLPLSDKQSTHKVAYPSTTKNIEYENTRSATLPLSDKQATKTHNVVYRVPTRNGKENLPVTRGTSKKYQLLLPPTPVNGNPPRKPAMPPNVNIEKFRVALESGYTTDDLSGGGVLDRMDTQLQYDEAIYEV